MTKTCEKLFWFGESFFSFTIAYYTIVQNMYS